MIPPSFLFEKIFKAFSSRIALEEYSTGNFFSYEELLRKIIQYHFFLSQYLEAGDSFVYLEKNSVEHIFLLFASLRGGFRFIPMNSRLKENEISLMLSQLKIKLLIYGNDFLGDVNIIQKEREIPYSISIEEVNRNLSSQYIEQNQKVSYNNDWILLFTSGTTGIPKAARLSIKMILMNIFSTVLFWDLSQNDSSVIHTPMFHAGGLNVLTTPLLFIGGKLILLEKFQPEILLQLINFKKINLLFAVPTMFKSMIVHPLWEKVDLSHMKFIISGGAPCPDNIYKEFEKKNFILRQGYGMTEVGVNCFFMTSEESRKYKGSVGRPMPFLEMNLVDPETKRIIKEEGEGELWLKGDLLFSGYENIPNEKTFHPKLGFCTGDIFYRNQDGFYWVRGRKKEIIIRGGENIYPIEIEKEVYLIDEILDCCVFGMDDDFWGEIPLLAISLRSDKINVNEIFQKVEFTLKTKLSSYKIPYSIVLFENLPKNSMGKISRLELKKLYTEKKFINIYNIKSK